MRRKGKCDFAHGPLELRVKESRRGKWGQRVQLQSAASAHDASSGSAGPAESLCLSGGEDVLGAARSIERVRAAEGSVSEFERSTPRRGNSNMINGIGMGVPMASGVSPVMGISIGHGMALGGLPTVGNIPPAPYYPVSLLQPIPIPVQSLGNKSGVLNNVNGGAVNRMPLSYGLPGPPRGHRVPSSSPQI